MPAQLSVQFQQDSLSDTAHIILMDSDNALITSVEPSLVSEITSACAAAQFTGKSGTFLALYTSAGPVLVGGIGGGIEAGQAAENWGGKLFSQLKKSAFHSTQFDVSAIQLDVALSVLAGAVMASYQFGQYFTKNAPKTIEAVITAISGDAGQMQSDWQEKQALIDGVFVARDLVYEPANKLYPEEFARRCTEFASLGLTIDVLDEPKLEELGMGALLGVGQGSARSSAVVVMRWQGGGDEAPIALVGKGVCFDTGGISIKPAKGMEDMKWDMGGSAAVTGAMVALAGRKVKRNVVGIIGLVENMPDGNAQRPGDVVTSMSGQTIEVINTDAEGRLVLADILTYVQQQYAPCAIVDLATLTGAILVSLGKEYAGLFANEDGLANAVIAAGEATEEKSWRMPLGKAYDEMLKSHIADMKNIGGPYGGSITAACFLQRFIENDTPWVHLDIAGKAWADKPADITPKGGTGFGVRMLNRLVDDYRA